MTLFSQEMRKNLFWIVFSCKARLTTAMARDNKSSLFLLNRPDQPGHQGSRSLA